MVVSKDLKPQSNTSLSTESAQAHDEPEQEFLSPAHSRAFELPRPPSSPPSRVPPHDEHATWETDLETRLLDEMRRVTQGYSLLSVQRDMAQLRHTIHDAPDATETQNLLPVVNCLDRLVTHLTAFHHVEHSPTKNQIVAQQDIAGLISRVRTDFIAMLLAFEERALLPPSPSPEEVYWAVENVAAVQKEIRHLNTSVQKISTHIDEMGSGEVLPFLLMRDELEQCSHLLQNVQKTLAHTQENLATQAQRQKWAGMRKALGKNAFQNPQSIQARLTEIEQLSAVLAVDEGEKQYATRQLLLTFVTLIRDLRAENPGELHAIDRLATLALHVGELHFLLAETVPDWQDLGEEEGITSPRKAMEVLTDVMADIDATEQFLKKCVGQGALKHRAFFEIMDQLPALKSTLSSMRVDVSKEVAPYEREQFRASLQTLQQRLLSTAERNQEASSQLGLYPLIHIAGALLSLGTDDEAAVISLVKTLNKAANGVLSAIVMMSSPLQENGNETPVKRRALTKMLEYAEHHAERGATKAEQLIVSRMNRLEAITQVRTVCDHFKTAANALKCTQRQFLSKTHIQKVTRWIRHTSRNTFHTIHKGTSAIVHEQSRWDKLKEEKLPWFGAKPAQTDIKRSLSMSVYPVIEALKILKMTTKAHQATLGFKRHYNKDTGKSEDARYDALSSENCLQAAAQTEQVFRWAQEKVTVLQSTLSALGELSLDAESARALLVFTAEVTPQLADFYALFSEWEVANEQQSTDRLDKIIWKMGNINSAIKRATELNVGELQSIYSDESKRVRHLGELLVEQKAKFLEEDPEAGARFDEKVKVLLQQHAAELAPARDGEVAQRILDAYTDAGNNMHLRVPTAEDVVSGVPGFWTKLAGSSPLSLGRWGAKTVTSGTMDTILLFSGVKLVTSITLKTLMFAYSLYHVDSTLERARKPWESADVTTAARKVVTNRLFRQFLFRIVKSALPFGALNVLLPVGQMAYLLTRDDRTELLSKNLSPGKITQEVGWIGGSRGMTAGMKVYNNSGSLNSNERHAEDSVPHHNDQLPVSEDYGTDRKAGKVKRAVNSEEINENDNAIAKKEIVNKLTYSQYNSLSEEAKNKTYFYAMNYVLDKIKNDHSIPKHARDNAYNATIGMKKIVPVDICGYKYTNAFFIPDSEGSKEGILVNLNDEGKPYTYIKSGKDIPINLVNNIDLKSNNSGGANGDYFMAFNPLEGSIGFHSVRTGGFDFKDNFNSNKPAPVDIYEMSERLASDFKEKHSNEPSKVNNEEVLKKAIVGSEMSEPDVRVTPVKYKMGISWAALTPSEYLRSFAQPFATLGGKLQQIASHVGGDDIQTTEKKVEQAQYVGAWVDVTVGTALSFTGTGVALSVAQSAAGVAADILENKAPDPFDVAGLILNAIPGGKISTHIGKFSQVGAKGFKYALKVGETTLDLAEVGISIKAAVDTGNALIIYEALSGVGLTMKGAKDMCRRLKKSPNMEPQEMVNNSEGGTKKQYNRDVINKPVETDKEFKRNPRKFKIGNKEILGNKKGKSFEISLDGGVTWTEGNKIQMLAYSLQNAGGGSKFPEGRGEGNNKVEEGGGGQINNGQTQERYNIGMERDLNKHLGNDNNPDEFFEKIKNGSRHTEVSTFGFFNRSLNGRVRDGVFEVSRDGGLTWKRGTWLQEAVWRIKYRGGKRKEIPSEELDKKINKASRKDPAAYSFSCYRAAFNDATQAGVINIKQSDWLNNTVTKKDSHGEIMDSQHYRQAFGLQSKKPLTTFNSANIKESGFMHVGERRPDGTVHYDHVVYVHVANNEIHLYQANGSEFLLTLNGSDANGENNNIGEHTSKSHYKHHMNEDRINLFNKYFKNDGNKEGSQPVFSFTTASEVRKSYTERNHSESVSDNSNTNSVGSEVGESRLDSKKVNAETLTDSIPHHSESVSDNSNTNSVGSEVGGPRLDLHKVDSETSTNSISSNIPDNRIKENIMDITKGMQDIESILDQPSEQCDTSTLKLRDKLKLTYPNTERVQLLFFKNAKEVATNHFAVRVTIDGKHYIADPTISQFRDSAPNIIGGREIFVGTESEWLDRMKTAHPNQMIVKSESNIPQTNIRLEDANGEVLVRPQWVDKQYSVKGLLGREKEWIRVLHIYRNNERFKNAMSSGRFKEAEKRTFFSNPPEETYTGSGLNVKLFKRVSMRTKNPRISNLTSTKNLENMNAMQRNDQMKYLKDMEVALTDELKSIDLDSVQLNYIDDLTLAVMDVHIRIDQLKLGLIGGLVGENKLTGTVLGNGHDKATVAASENGEIVQRGVSQNTVAFIGTDANNTQKDSAENKENKPKTRDKRFIKPHQAEAEIEQSRKTLKQLNQPILNPQQRIQERIVPMINQYNEGKPEKSWLTPDTPVRVTVTSKKRIQKSAQGAFVKSAQNISPDHSVTFTLKDVMSGKYKYELDRLTGHKLSDYKIVIQEDKKITKQVTAFINSVDRNALQSSLQDETDQYFDNPDNAKGFSNVLERLVKMRVLAYLDEHGDDNEFSQHLRDFYEGKIPAHDLYIDGVRVPGVFSFKIGEGIGSKTLVLNIYTNESFIFETKNISGRTIVKSGMTRRKDFPVDDMVLPSAWDGFNKMIQRALPLYEQRKYTDKENPFKYKKKRIGAPRTLIEFKSGSYMDDMPTQVMKDTKNKIKQNYDTLIYSNSEQMLDYGMLLTSKIITPVSLGASVASGPLGIVLTLGIDAAYVAAKFTQAQMSDNPTESDEIKSEAIWESVFLGTGVVGETADVALKSYRGLKTQLRKTIKTMGETSDTKPNIPAPGKVEVPSTTGLKEKPAGSLSAVTETLPSSKSPVIEIANEVTERAIPTTKGQRYIYQLGETGGEKWKVFEEYVNSSRSRHDIPAGNVFGELTVNRKSAVFNTPQPDSLSKLTINDRLDIPVHGSSFSPSDAGSKRLNIPRKNYSAKYVAKQLHDRGLREVGVLRIDSCNLGDGRYLDDLKIELDKLGIKFGYLCAPKGSLHVTHLPGTNIRPVWTWRFMEPWRVVKGNAHVNFPGTKYNSQRPV